VAYVRKAQELIASQIDFAEKCLLAELTAATYCPLRTKPKSKLKWTGSIVDWVELIYAFHEAGVINGGKVTLKTLFRTMGEVFDFEVKEFSNYFMNIKRRIKGDRTTFLDKLRRKLLRRMDEADRKPGRR
jgi:hypothetical protein